MTIQMSRSEDNDYNINNNSLVHQKRETESGSSFDVVDLIQFFNALGDSMENDNENFLPVSLHTSNYKDEADLKGNKSSRRVENDFFNSPKSHGLELSSNGSDRVEISTSSFNDNHSSSKEINMSLKSSPKRCQLPLCSPVSLEATRKKEREQTSRDSDRLDIQQGTQTSTDIASAHNPSLRERFSLFRPKVVESSNNEKQRKTLHLWHIQQKDDSKARKRLQRIWVKRKGVEDINISDSSNESNYSSPLSHNASNRLIWASSGYKSYASDFDSSSTTKRAFHELEERANNEYSQSSTESSKMENKIFSPKSHRPTLKDIPSIANLDRSTESGDKAHKNYFDSVHEATSGILSGNPESYSEQIFNLKGHEATSRSHRSLARHFSRPSRHQVRISKVVQSREDLFDSPSSFETLRQKLQSKWKSNFGRNAQ